MILGAFTGLLSRGGVQRAGQLVAAALARRAQERGEAFRFLGLNDPPGPHEFEAEGQPLALEGFGGRKDRLARAVAVSAPKARLFYMNHPGLAPLGLIFRSLNPRGPYVVNGHGIDVWEPLSPLPRFALKRAARVALPSRYSAEKTILEQGVLPERVEVVEWGLETKFLQAAEDSADASSAAASDPREGPTLLAVARLAKTERRKGLESSLRAFPKVLERVPRARFAIAGDGDARESMRALAKELGVSGSVEFPGAVSDGELCALYRGCDAFVMPSAKEGFGLSYLEAAAFGKPSLGGDAGGAPEVVLDGETGLLAPWDDPDAIAEKLVALLESKDLRERLGQAARERLMANFTFRAFERRFGAMLDSVANG